MVSAYPALPRARKRRYALEAAGLGRAADTVVRTAATWSLPALLTVALSGIFVGRWGWDLRAMVDAGRAYMHGSPPYPPAGLAPLTGQEAFVYPLPVAAFFAPLALAGWHAAVAIFALFSVACVVAALRLLGVRDRRCYVAAFLLYPMQDSIALGTLTPALLLGVAAAWRFRRHALAAGACVALVVVSKLFLWPLLVWLVATRRLRAAAFAAAAGAYLVVALTLPLGVGAITHYGAVLGDLSSFEAPLGFSPAGLLADAGVRLPLASLLALAASLPLFAATVRSGRRGDDFLAFRLAIATALLCSPIVWGHYLIVLLAPVALLSPRLSPRWFLLGWVTADLPLHLHHPWPATGLVLLLVLVQLDLVPRVRELGERARSWLIPLGSVAGTALLLWVALAMASHRLLVAALTRHGGDTRHSGTAFVELAPHGTSVCVRAWIDGLPRGAQAALSGPGLRVLALAVAGDGTRWACGTVARSAMSALDAQPHRYRLVVRGGGFAVSGRLENRLDAGRPPGAGAN